ncbi:T9SS type A sorting domain-containing protein [Flavobacterium sp.]|uniref:T9SS type A sorting domain-containing protein n=1 Tax=Flavobacterium sp. TaxID=239 RepID=UPI00286BF759|nr:T9SS type A sorting domain-containing protein [Flavobacterium sp.]
MNKKYSLVCIYFFLVSLVSNTLCAQSIEWMRDGGSTPFSANERGDAVAVDTNNNSYSLGHLAIDSYISGLFVPAHEDGFLAKYDASGNVQWVRTFGGPGFVDIQESSIKVSTADNAVYVCGSFRTQTANSVITFDGISFTYAGNSRHGFLAKYDLNGNIQWMRHGGGTVGLGTGYNDLDIDDQGRIVVVGTADGTNTFDSQTLTYDGGILIRYLPDGTLANLIQLNNTTAEHQEAREVEVAPGTGNIYVGGAFFGAIALNSFTANSFVFSVFELKLDANLTCQWLSNGGGTYGSWINGLAIDANENSYIAGHASGTTVSFGPHTFNGYTASDSEIITVKFNPEGVPQWLRHGGSLRNDEAWDIISDTSGNTVITGFLGGNVLTANFDSISVTLFTQSKHCFIARYDTDGNIVYAKRLGGGSDDVGLGLALANENTFYLTGTTWGSTLWGNWNYQSCCLDPNFFVAKFNDTFNQAITNNECVGSIGLTPGSAFGINPITGSILGATTTTTITPTCLTAFGFDVWYSFTVPPSGNLTIETQVADQNSMTDSVLTAYTGTCGVLTQIGCDDNGGLPGVNDLMSVLNLTNQTPNARIYLSVGKSDTTPPDNTNNQFRISVYDPSLATNTFDNANFLYYPNPVKNVLNLNYNQAITTVAVSNLLGQEVITKSLNANQGLVDMSNLASGIYLVKVTANLQTKTIKISKE